MFKDKLLFSLFKAKTIIFIKQQQLPPSSDRNSAIDGSGEDVSQLFNYFFSILT